MSDVVCTTLNDQRAITIHVPEQVYRTAAEAGDLETLAGFLSERAAAGVRQMLGLPEKAGLALPWWEAIDEKERALAIKICATHSSLVAVDQMVSPGMPVVFDTPGGRAAAIDPAKLTPLWVQYVWLARAALALARDHG